jgi:phage gpG-like protein
MESMHIEVDDSDWKARLGEFSKKMPTIARRMMGKIATEIKKEVRKGPLSGGVLKVQSGNLKKSIAFKTRPNYTVIIRNKMYYSGMQEKGANVTSDDGGLHFKIGGQWRVAESVTLPARPFLKPVIDSYFGSTKAEEIMEKVFQEALDKLNSGGTVGSQGIKGTR